MVCTLGKHGVKSNLFLALGEGATKPELSGNGAGDGSVARQSGGLQDALRMMRGQGNG